MKHDDRLIANLKRLGLTDYGARAYLALVTHGPQGAAAVAERSGGPRSKVYEVALADWAMARVSAFDSRWRTASSASRFAAPGRCERAKAATQRWKPSTISW